MGNIRWKSVKRIGDALLSNHYDSFSLDFNHNKETIKYFCDDINKSIRNKLAGYITRKVYQKEHGIYSSRAHAREKKTTYTQRRRKSTQKPFYLGK